MHFCAKTTLNKVLIYSVTQLVNPEMSKIIKIKIPTE